VRHLSDDEDSRDLGAEILRRAAPLSVECPRCRAIAGVACSDGGGPRQRAHHERSDAALRQMLEWALAESERRRAALS
jgi:hypothetical protein